MLIKTVHAIPETLFVMWVSFGEFDDFIVWYKTNIMTNGNAIDIQIHQSEIITAQFSGVFTSHSSPLGQTRAHAWIGWVGALPGYLRGWGAADQDAHVVARRNRRTGRSSTSNPPISRTVIPTFSKSWTF